MAWQPKAREKRTCARCGKTYFVMQPTVGALPEGNASGNQCPDCRKRPWSKLARSLEGPGKK
jgi:DNA-directed RNA polymerase subunit RPC12/RpoP